MKLLRFVTLAIVLTSSVPLFGFNLFGKSAVVPDFGKLSNQRDELADKIADYEKSIAEREHEIATLPEHDVIAARVRTAQTDLKKAQKEAVPNQDQIEGLQKYIEELTSQEKRRQQIPAVVAEQKRELAVAKRELRNIDAQLEEQLAAASRNDNYTTTISIAFTILVSVVIIGFYIVALRKEQIAEAIFAGEQGMQFVTLFLIVIAIILFGIMGTLEGKELSALLGGLSGYILGRTGRAADQKNAGPSFPNPNIPNPNVPNPNAPAAKVPDPNVLDPKVPDLAPSRRSPD